MTTHMEQVTFAWGRRNVQAILPHSTSDSQLWDTYHVTYAQNTRETLHHSANHPLSIFPPEINGIHFSPSYVTIWYLQSLQQVVMFAMYNLAYKKWQQDSGRQLHKDFMGRNGGGGSHLQENTEILMLFYICVHILSLISW